MWKICIRITYRIPLVNLPPNFDPGPGFLYKGDLDSLKVRQLFRNLKVSRVTWSRCLKAISGLPPETVGHLLWWTECSYRKSLWHIFAPVALLNMLTYRPVGLLDLNSYISCWQGPSTWSQNLLQKAMDFGWHVFKSAFLVYHTTCSCLFVCTVSCGSYFGATLFNRMRQHIVFCQLLQQIFALAQIAIAIAIAWQKA